MTDIPLGAYRTMGRLHAAVNAQDPVARLAEPEAVIFCFDASGFPSRDAVVEYARGAWEIFPRAQLLVEGLTSQTAPVPVWARDHAR